MSARARFWLLLAATAAALAAVNVLHVPPVVAELARLLGGTPLLDMRPRGYGPGEVAALLQTLGPQGRRLYLELLWTVDLALPALFSAFLWSALSRGALRRLAWAGLLGGAADYLENAAITALLEGFPAAPTALIRAASALTSVKWALYLGAGALALAGAVLPCGRAWRCSPTARGAR
jgi:hypothetical protein